MSAPTDTGSLSPPPAELASHQQASDPVRPPEGVQKANVSHVRAIMREQFAAEVGHKEAELGLIGERIHLAKLMLQRLRLGVLAQHYGVAAFYPTALDYREETIGEQHNWETFEEELVARQDQNTDTAGQEAEEGGGESVHVKEEAESVTERNSAPVPTPIECNDGVFPTEEPTTTDSTTPISTPEVSKPVPMETNTPPPPVTKAIQENSIPHEESRFYSKKRVIVGNTSQYLDPTAHHVTMDGATHKWMVYVRGPQVEPDISHFVKAVRFFLHPSYHPNDIVRVSAPPFHLTRLGWGEFPIRVQLEFSDKSNKSVDIIHNLVLDRTHTGQQTLGAETLVDLDIVTPPTQGEGQGKGFRLNGLSTTRATVICESEGEASRSSTPLGSLPSSSGMSHPLSPDVHMQVEPDETTPLAAPLDHTPDPLAVSSSSSQLVTGVLTTNLDKCLHNAVRAIPIYGKPTSSEDFYIPAPSLAQFKQWHVGRRRATEWERAVAIKRSIHKRLKVPSLLSTKQIMQWCRQNGYTPLDPVPAGGRGFCKVCGCQLEAGVDQEEEEWAGGEGEEEGIMEGVGRRCPEVHEHCQLRMFGHQALPLRGNSMDPFEELHPDLLNLEPEDASLPRLCSLSHPHDLVASLLTQQSSLEEEAGRRQEEDVDICFLPSSPSCARSRALVEMVPRFRVPQTPELKWVQQTAASIGIHIYPAVIDRMYAHVVEHMIYISCARFLRGILGQAVQGAGQILEGRLSQDRILTPFHVQQAFLKLEHCDFLTNCYLGVQPRLQPEGGGAQAQCRSLSRTGSGQSSSSADSSTGDEEEVGGRTL